MAFIPALIDNVKHLRKVRLILILLNPIERLKLFKIFIVLNKISRNDLF